MQGRQAGQWAANGNNKKQIKMPGNNFCQRVSLSLSTAGNLQQKCELFAQVQREVCQRTVADYRGKGVGGRGLSCKSCQHPGNAASYYAGHKIANHAICAHFDCELRVQSAQTVWFMISWGSVLYTCVYKCVCAVCTNFSNHTKPDSAEILIIVCEAASQSITQISCSTSKDDDGGICNVSRQAQDSAVRA